MRALPWSSPVTVWTVTGSGHDFDHRVDTDVRARRGAGEWTRRCGVCGSGEHGRRVYVPAAGEPVVLSVSHGDGLHVAATGWGRLEVGIDLVAERDSAVLDGSWLRHWLPPATLDTTRHLVPDDHHCARMRLWAAREARAKVTGQGLGDGAVPVPLVALHPTLPDRTSHARGHDGSWAAWSLPGHVCVLVAARSARLVPAVRDASRAPVAVSVSASATPW